MYACYTLGAVMRSTNDMDAKYAIQLLTEVELIFLSCTNTMTLTQNEAATVCRQHSSGPI